MSDWLGFYISGLLAATFGGILFRWPPRLMMTLLIWPLWWVLFPFVLLRLRWAEEAVNHIFNWAKE